MRAIWSGTVAFGLVSVPVKLYSATRSHDISLHQVHDEDGGRIRYQRRCEVCEKKIDYDHIDKAYDDGEDTVVITDEDLKAMPAEEEKEIEVVQFVPDEQIDPMMFEKSYYLEPASKNPKAYALLRETLEEAGRTAIVTFALRSRTRLAALRVRDDVIVLQTMLWADEIRSSDGVSSGGEAKISARERKMARSLVDQFSEDFEPEQFVDEYQEQLRTLIEEKLEHGDAIDTDATFGDVDEGEAEGGDVIDLMEALKRSVDERRKSAPKKSGSSSKSSSSKKASGGRSAGKKRAGATSKAESSAKPSAKKGSAKKGSSKTGAEKKDSSKTGAEKKASAKKGSATKAFARKGSSEAEGSSTKKSPAKSKKSA
ncbi:MAG: Ku protein [Brevibacterium yomogidense]